MTRDVTKPPLPTDDVVEDCTIGFGADLARRRVIVQFDRHVRCLSLDEDGAVELIRNLAKALAMFGVIVTRDGADSEEQTH